MAGLGKISAAMELIDEKKEKLRKSFEDLQSLSPSSLNFTLKWTDIDSYFITLRSSLLHKFNLLRTLNPSPDKISRPARPEVKSLCENSDGLGLRRFFMDRSAVWSELADAYRCAPDAASMVLDAMEGFYSRRGTSRKGNNSMSIRSSCVTMLEELMRVKPEVTPEVKEKAMKVALQWKQKMVSFHVKEDRNLEVLGFLLLVGAYGLMDGFSLDELIDCFVVVAKKRQAVELCRAIIPADKISDVIQKLIDNDMEVTAVRLSIEFQKTDKFPPVPLLEECRLKAQKLSKKMRENQKYLGSHHDAVLKELGAVSAIIKCIDDYDLESEYPKDNLVALVNELEKQKRNKKRPPTTTTPASTNPQPPKPQKPKLKNRPQAHAPAVHTTVQNVQQLHVESAGLLPNHLAQYHGAPPGSYGLTGPLPMVPYGDSMASPYGFTGPNLGFSGNPLPGGSNFYVSEPHPPSGWWM